MKRIILFFAFYSVAPLYAQQNKIDSLQKVLATSKEDTNKVKILASLANELDELNPKKAIEYADMGLLLSRKFSFKKGISACLNALGNATSTLGENAKALEFYNERFKVASEMNDSLAIAGVYDNIGVMYLNWGNVDTALKLRKMAVRIYSSLNDLSRLAIGYLWIGNIYMNKSENITALDYYLKSLELFEKLNDPNIGFVFINISNIYRLNMQFEKAKKYALDANYKFTEAKNKYGMGASLVRLSLVYIEEENYDSSIINLLEAKRLFEEIGDKSSIAAVTNILGDTFRSMGDYSKALDYLKAALSIAREINNVAHIAAATGNIGTIYKEQKQYLKALPYVQESERIFNKLRDKKNLRISIKELLEIYNYLKKPDSVLKYFSIYQQLSDSIYNEQSTEAIAEMQTKYETQKKELVIESQKESIRRQEKEKMFLWGGIILLSALFFTIVILFFQTKRQEAIIIKERNAVSNLTGILKHETARQFNSLVTSISKILRVNNPQQQVSKAIVNVKTYQMLYEKLFLSSGFASISLKSAFEKLFEYNCGEYGINRTPMFVVTGDGDILFKETDYLFHLINELIANSLLHAFNDIIEPKITIDIKKENSAYEIAYTDNGCGISPEKQQIIPGKGYYYITAYVTQNLNGTLETDFTKGSKFKITFDTSNGN